MESSPNTNPKTPKDETNSKGSPDTSAINDPIALRHQHRFDVSRQKRGSVIIVDYKNDSPYNNRSISPPKMSPKSNFSGVSGASGASGTPMVKDRFYSKSAFARPMIAVPPTPSSRVDSPDNSTKKKMANILSFSKWQKVLARNASMSKNKSALSMKRSIQKDLDNTLQRQKKEQFDFGDKITAMCVSSDEQYIILATHSIEAAPKIKIQAPESLKTEQTESISTFRPNEEKPLLNILNMGTGRSLNNPSVGERKISEERPQDENLAAVKKPPVLWLFDMKERTKERLPLESDFDDPQREIVSLAILKSNEFIIIASNDKSLFLYSMREKNISYYFRNVTEQNITSISVTHDDKYCLVGGSKDGIMNIFNLQRKTLAATIKDPIHKDWLKCVALSPDLNNTLIAAGYYDGTISVIDRQSREVLHRFNINQDQQNKKNMNFIGTLQVTNDLKYVTVGCDDKSIEVWNIQEEKLVHTFKHVHEKKITSLSIGSDDRYLISGSFDGSISLIDLEKREFINSYPHVHQGLLSHVFISPTGKYIISGGSDGIMQIIDLHRKELVGEIHDTHKGGVDVLTVSPDNRYIASGSYDGSIMFHYLESRKLLKCIESAHPCPIKTIRYTFDSKHLISGGDDGTVKIWAIFTWELVHTFPSLHKNWITSMAITTNDKIMVTGSLDNSIKITLLSPYEHLHTYNNTHISGVTCLKITSNNRMIISGGGDGSIRVSNMNFKKKGTLHIFSEAHKGPVKALAITKDNKYFVSASTSGSIKVFYLEKREYLHTIKHAHDDEINALALSRDNKYIISASADRSIRIFDFRSRKRIHTFKDAHEKSISSMTLSMDNHNIITGGNDNMIKIFINPYSTINFTVTESDRISSVSYMGLFILNYFLNEPDPNVKHDLITKYPDLAIYPYQLNLFHIVALFFPRKDLIKFCMESKISFSGDSYGRTPLHYLLNSEKVDFNNINYLLENFDNLALNATESFKLMAEVTQDLPSILKLSPHLVINLLKNAVGNPLSYKNENITQFGHILGGGYRRSVPYRMPIFTPEIKGLLLDEQGSQLLSVKVVLFHMDYDICSEELLKILDALQHVDNEEIFKTKVISVLIDYAWNLSKVHLWILMTIYSAYMILLSYYASQQENNRSLAIEIILLVFGFGFLGYEGLQFLSAGRHIYFSDLWNFVDIVGNSVVIATMFTDSASPDSLARKWLMSISLILGYSKWVSFFRIIEQTRKLIRIIVMTIYETRHFLFLLFVAIMGFSLCFYQFDDPNDTSYSARLLLVYNLLYAQFVDDDYNSSQIFYLVVTTVILTVMLLNLLIAIMGNVYKKFLLMSIMSDSKERLLLTIETITVKRMFQRLWNAFKKFSLRRRGPQLYKEVKEIQKSYLFFVEDAKIEIEEENRTKEWERRFKLVQEIVDSEMNTNNENMKTKMIGLEQHVQKQKAQMMVMKESMGKRLTDLEKHMAKAIGILNASKNK